MSVLNAVANKILHMIFALIAKKQLYKETKFQYFFYIIEIPLCHLIRYPSNISVLF